MAKITDFKLRDKIRRKDWIPGWHILLGEQIMSLKAEDILYGDWEIFKEKVKKVGWINIYPGGSVLGVHKTREDADKASCEFRVDCIKIEWEE